MTGTLTKMHTLDLLWVDMLCVVDALLMLGFLCGHLLL